MGDGIGFRPGIWILRDALIGKNPEYKGLRLVYVQIEYDSDGEFAELKPGRLG